MWSPFRSTRTTPPHAAAAAAATAAPSASSSSYSSSAATGVDASATTVHHTNHHYNNNNNNMRKKLEPDEGGGGSGEHGISDDEDQVARLIENLTYTCSPATTPSRRIEHYKNKRNNLRDDDEDDDHGSELLEGDEEEEEEEETHYDEEEEEDELSNDDLVGHIGDFVSASLASMLEQTQQTIQEADRHLERDDFWEDNDDDDDFHLHNHRQRLQHPSTPPSSNNNTSTPPRSVSIVQQSPQLQLLPTQPQYRHPSHDPAMWTVTSPMQHTPAVTMVEDEDDLQLKQQLLAKFGSGGGNYARGGPLNSNMMTDQQAQQLLARGWVLSPVSSDLTPLTILEPGNNNKPMDPPAYFYPPAHENLLDFVQESVDHDGDNDDDTDEQQLRHHLGATSEDLVDYYSSNAVDGSNNNQGVAQKGCKEIVYRIVSSDREEEGEDYDSNAMDVQEEGEETILTGTEDGQQEPEQEHEPEPDEEEVVSNEDHPMEEDFEDDDEDGETPKSDKESYDVVNDDDDEDTSIPYHPFISGDASTATTSGTFTDGIPSTYQKLPPRAPPRIDSQPEEDEEEFQYVPPPPIFTDLTTDLETDLHNERLDRYTAIGEVASTNCSDSEALSSPMNTDLQLQQQQHSEASAESGDDGQDPSAVSPTTNDLRLTSSLDSWLNQLKSRSYQTDEEVDYGNDSSSQGSPPKRRGHVHTDHHAAINHHNSNSNVNHIEAMPIEEEEAEEDDMEEDKEEHQDPVAPPPSEEYDTRRDEIMLFVDTKPPARAPDAPAASPHHPKGRLSPAPDIVEHRNDAPAASPLHQKGRHSPAPDIFEHRNDAPLPSPHHSKGRVSPAPDIFEHRNDILPPSPHHSKGRLSPAPDGFERRNDIPPPSPHHPKGRLSPAPDGFEHRHDVSVKSMPIKPTSLTNNNRSSPTPPMIPPTTAITTTTTAQSVKSVPTKPTTAPTVPGNKQTLPSMSWRGTLITPLTTRATSTPATSTATNNNNKAVKPTKTTSLATSTKTASAPSKPASATSTKPASVTSTNPTSASVGAKTASAPVGVKKAPTRPFPGGIVPTNLVRKTPRPAAKPEANLLPRRPRTVTVMEGSNRLLRGTAASRGQTMSVQKDKDTELQKDKPAVVQREKTTRPKPVVSSPKASSTSSSSKTPARKPTIGFSSTTSRFAQPPSAFKTPRDVSHPSVAPTASNDSSPKVRVSPTPMVSSRLLKPTAASIAQRLCSESVSPTASSISRGTMSSLDSYGYGTNRRHAATATVPLRGVASKRMVDGAPPRPSSRPKPRVITTAKSPHFATNAKYGSGSSSRPPPIRPEQPSLANSNMILQKRLRDISPTNSSVRSRQSILTIPRSPNFATSARSRERKVVIVAGSKDNDDISMANSTDFLMRGLRNDGPTAKRDAKLTIPVTPKFQESHKRSHVKSHDESDQEIMDYYNTHQFKALPLPSTTKTQPAPIVAAKPHHPTEPVPFHFHTAARNRASTPSVTSTDPMEQQRTASRPSSMRARPSPETPQGANSSSSSTVRPKKTGPPPSAPNLATSTRSASREAARETWERRAAEMKRAKQILADRRQREKHLEEMSKPLEYSGSAKASASTMQPYPSAKLSPEGRVEKLKREMAAKRQREAGHPSSPPKTIPQPFNLRTTERPKASWDALRKASEQRAEAIKRARETLAAKRQAERHLEEMKAAVDTSASPTKTVVEPFTLHTDERHAKYQELLADKQRRQMEEEERLAKFRARPCPETTWSARESMSSPPHVHQRPPTTPEPFHLQSLSRHELYQQELQKRLKEEEEKAEQEEERMRKSYRANPVPRSTYQYVSPIHHHPHLPHPSHHLHTHNSDETPSTTGNVPESVHVHTASRHDTYQKRRKEAEEKEAEEEEARRLAAASTAALPPPPQSAAYPTAMSSSSVASSATPVDEFWQEGGTTTTTTGGNVDDPGGYKMDDDDDESPPSLESECDDGS